MFDSHLVTFSSRLLTLKGRRWSLLVHGGFQFLWVRRFDAGAELYSRWEELGADRVP